GCLYSIVGVTSTGQPLANCMHPTCFIHSHAVQVRLPMLMNDEVILWRINSVRTSFERNQPHLHCRAR
ncbi:MAG: hypothetical protein FWE05_07150, partial [Defluviitaleaceae bacterium]|nr:hypothetical protein [Defluviitaleaceae bacterium]